MDVVALLVIVFGAVTVLYAAGWVFVLFGQARATNENQPKAMDREAG